MAIDPDPWIDRLLKVWTTIRPLAHSRLAFLGMLVGSAILVGPLWEPFLRGAILHFFKVTIDPPVHPMFGLAVVVASLAYHLVALRLTASPPVKLEISAHDREVAENFRQQFTFAVVVEAADSVASSHRIRNEARRQFETVIDFLERPENAFVDQECRVAAEALRSILVEFLNFLAQHFFVFPGRQRGENWQFALYPELNWDTGNPTREQEVIYFTRARELSEIVDRVRSAFQELSQIINARIRS